MAKDSPSSFLTYMDATTPERQQDIRRYIEAFTRTGASAHPSLVAGTDPPDLAAIPAFRGTRPRLLRLFPIQRRESSPSPCQLLTRAHPPCWPPSDWTVRKPSHLLNRLVGRKRLGTRRPPGSHGLPCPYTLNFARLSMVVMPTASSGGVCPSRMTADSGTLQVVLLSHASVSVLCCFRRRRVYVCQRRLEVMSMLFVWFRGTPGPRIGKCTSKQRSTIAQPLCDTRCTQQRYAPRSLTVCDCLSLGRRGRSWTCIEGVWQPRWATLILCQYGSLRVPSSDTLSSLCGTRALHNVHGILGRQVDDNPSRSVRKSGQLQCFTEGDGLLDVTARIPLSHGQPLHKRSFLAQKRERTQNTFAHSEEVRFLAEACSASAKFELSAKWPKKNQDKGPRVARLCCDMLPVESCARTAIHAGLSCTTDKQARS